MRANRFMDTKILWLFDTSNDWICYTNDFVARDLVLNLFELRSFVFFIYKCTYHFDGYIYICLQILFKKILF